MNVRRLSAAEKDSGIMATGPRSFARARWLPPSIAPYQTARRYRAGLQVADHFGPGAAYAATENGDLLVAEHFFCLGALSL